MTDTSAAVAEAPLLTIAPVDPQHLQALALLAEAGIEARDLYPDLFAPDSPAYGVPYPGTFVLDAGCRRHIRESSVAVVSVEVVPPEVVRHIQVHMTVAVHIRGNDSLAASRTDSDSGVC